MEHNTSDQNTQNHNAVVRSSLSAGNDIHIGDKHYHAEKSRKGFWTWRASVGLVATIAVFLWVGLFLTQKIPAGAQEIPSNTASSPTLKNNMVPDDPQTATPIPLKEKSTALPSKLPLRLLAQGVVNDISGAPIEGVRITVVGLDAEVITNKNGSYKIEVKTLPTSNEYRLRFYKLGYQTNTETYFEVPKIIEKRLFPDN